MRILIVDDDYFSRVKLKAMLSRYGDCDAMPGGNVALEMFLRAHSEGVPYDLVTLDIDMPDMPGQDVLLQMRSWERDNKQTTGDGVPVLMITVMEDATSVVTSFMEGCHWYLVKPLSREKLENALRSLGLLESDAPAEPAAAE